MLMLQEKTFYLWQMVWASFMVVPAARMCWGSKVIMACISRMVA